jgi:hypothetical protein
MPRVRRSLLVLTAAGLGLAGGGLLLHAGASRVVRDRGRSAAAPQPATVSSSAAGRAPAPRAGVPADAPAAAVAPAPAGPPSRQPVCGRQILFEADVAPRSGPLAQVARDLLAEHRGALGLDAVPGELVLAREVTTLAGHHVRFRQVVGGVPVEGSEVSAHVAPDGRPLLLHADVFPVGDVATVPAVSPADAETAVRALLLDADDSGPLQAKAPVLLIRPEGHGGRLVWRVDVRTADASSRVSVDALDGEVVDVRDLRVAAEGQGRVFQPNPILAARDASLRDKRDAPTLALDQLLVDVTLLRLDGTHRLRGTWCDAAHGTGDVYSPWDDWKQLTRADDAFENVNAYWHVDRAQQHLVDLGITGANQNRQTVEPRATAQDQSYYDIFDDAIRFGTGGVDDAEDGDVVVHEYGHAIQYDQVDEWGATSEGATMGEGWGDFFACALHSDPAAPAPHWDPLVASWDATSYSRTVPPYLRRVDRSKVYPRDVQDEPHADGEIWSRFLWDLRGLLGHDDAMRVAVESHTFLTSNARFIHGANAILVANRSLRAGRDDTAIRGLLRARGIPISEPPLGAPPEDSFEQNDDSANAAPVAPGVLSDLLLADDDWFEVSLPPLRRLVARANFDPADLDLDLELSTVEDVVLARSAGISGQETVSCTAGNGGGTFRVRAYRRAGEARIAGYTLALLDVDVESVKPGSTTARTVPAGGVEVVSVPVVPEKAGAKLVVTSLVRGKGAVNDVRVISPTGVVAAEFGVGANARGARVTVTLSETGDWRVEVRPRSGTSGKYALQTKLR